MNFTEPHGVPASARTKVDTKASPAPAVRLSAIEWSVVAVARLDRLASLNAPGRVSMALGRLFGGLGTNPRLADSRLEALRRIAVLAWHYGYTIPTEELRSFLAAGFSLNQYELVQDSIGQARSTRGARTPK
jgi:hypothetical protein